MKYLEELKKRYNINDRIIEKNRDLIKQIKKIRERPLKIELELEMEPVAAQRTRKNRKTGHFYVPGAKVNRKTIQKLAGKQLPEDFEKIKTEIKINIKSYLPIPKAFSKSEKYLAELGLIRPITKPDIDNLEKTILDGFNKFLWYDDSQVVDSRSRKFYSCHPRVEVIVKYQPMLFSKLQIRNQKNKIKEEEIE